MFAPPPKMNLISINSNNCKDQLAFYRELGVLFKTGFNEGERKCYTYTYGDFIFEINEVRTAAKATKNITISFLIDEIDGYLEGLRNLGISIINDSWKTKTHQNIQLIDPDGNLIILMTKI